MGLILDSVDCFAFFNKDPPGLHTVANKANSKTMLVSELKADEELNRGSGLCS